MTQLEAYLTFVVRLQTPDSQGLWRHKTAVSRRPQEPQEDSQEDQILSYEQDARDTTRDGNLW